MMMNGIKKKQYNHFSIGLMATNLNTLSVDASAVGPISMTKKHSTHFDNSIEI